MWQPSPYTDLSNDEETSSDGDKGSAMAPLHSVRRLSVDYKGDLKMLQIRKRAFFLPSSLPPSSVDDVLVHPPR